MCCAYCSQEKVRNFLWGNITFPQEALTRDHYYYVVPGIVLEVLASAVRKEKEMRAL